MKRIALMMALLLCCVLPARAQPTAESILAGMTLEAKIGQMFVLDMPNYNDKASTSINPAVQGIIDKYHPGGVIFFSKNITTPQKTAAFIADMQAASNIPMFVSLDEEGGKVSRLYPNKNMPGAKVPTAASIGKTGDPQTAYDYMANLTKLLKELGFNLDFAPVADVNTNPKNPVVGSRAYGTVPEKTAPFVVAAIKGLQDNGVIATAKHFPGLGDSSTDPHNGLTVIKNTPEDLNSVEFVTFREAIAANVDFIMTGHINTPNATTDGLPATMSRQMLTDILRNQLGFKGVIITDAMNMGAITKLYSPEEATLNAASAGADIILMPANVDRAYNALLNAVKTGAIPESRIDESVTRILDAKIKYGIIR